MTSETKSPSALLLRLTQRLLGDPNTQSFWKRMDWLSVGFALLAVGAGIAIAPIAEDLPGNIPLLVMLLGGVVMVVMVRYIEVGLLLFLFISYIALASVLRNFYNGPSIGQPITLVMLSSVIIRAMVFKERPGGLGTPMMVLVIYGSVGALSVLYAYDPSVALEVFLDYVKDALTVVAIVALIQRGETLRRSVWALLAAGIFLGTLSTYQYFTGTFDNAYWGFARARVGEIVAESSDSYRLAGPLGDPNAFAMMMALLVPLALDRMWNDRQRIMRLVAAFALVVCALTVFFTYSRSGFLAMIAGAGVLLVRRPPKLPVALLTVGMLFVINQFLPAQYTERLLTITDLFSSTTGDVRNESSFRGRASEMTVGLMMFMDYPLTGVGWGNYNANYQRYSSQLGLDTRRTDRSAHNLYLELAAEKGLLGIGAFVLVLGIAFRSLWQGYALFKTLGQAEYANLTLGLGAALIGHMTMSFFLHDAYPRFFWMLIALIYAVPHSARIEREQAKINHQKRGHEVV